MRERPSKSARFVEVFFGGLAKGMLVVVAVAAVILAVLSGDDGLTDLPTTRKEWGYFLLIVLISVAGFISFCWFRHRSS